MTRADQLKAALDDLVESRRAEIDALTSVRIVGIVLTLDDAGCVDLEQVRYESKREKHRRSLGRDTRRAS